MMAPVQYSAGITPRRFMGVAALGGTGIAGAAYLSLISSPTASGRSSPVRINPTAGFRNAVQGSFKPLAYASRKESMTASEAASMEFESGHMNAGRPAAGQFRTHDFPDHTPSPDRTRSRLRSLAFAMLFAVFALTLAACASIGQPFPSGMVSELHTGKTTKAEVRTLLGQPWRVGLEDGWHTWTYGNYRYSLMHPLVPTQAEDLVIQFDAQGVVRHYSYNTSMYSNAP